MEEPIFQANRDLPGMESGRHTLASRHAPKIVPFVLGLLLGPAFVLLHECGHLVGGLALGLRPRLHYADVSAHVEKALPPRVDAIFAASGPAVQLVLGAVGACWLYGRRRRRRAEMATWLDWFATCLVLNGGRGLASGISATISGTNLKDEMSLAMALGIAPWLVFAVLGLIGLGLFVFMIRLHPPGSRLAPFVCLFVGCTLGVNLWLHVLGPRLLP